MDKIKDWIESSVILNWIKGNVVRIIIIVAFLTVVPTLYIIGFRFISMCIAVLLAIVAYIYDEKLLYASLVLVPIF